MTYPEDSAYAYTEPVETTCIPSKSSLSSSEVFGSASSTLPCTYFTLKAYQVLDEVYLHE